MKYFIGIDPGLTGAIALVDSDGNLHEIEDLPVMVRGTGKGIVKKCINAKALQNLLYAWICERGDICAYIENVNSMPGQGVASMFSMGDTFGSIRSVLICEDIETAVVAPQVWKKAMKLTSDKELSLETANRIFYNHREHFNRKKDHNRAEAALLARYGALNHEYK